MLHNILLNLIIMMPIKHSITTIQIRDNKIHNFIILTAITINNPGIVVILVFDGFFHGSEGKLLFFVIGITTDLNSHGADETRIEDLVIAVFLVHEFCLVDEVGERE